jgi:hypothetical protein
MIPIIPMITMIPMLPLSMVNLSARLYTSQQPGLAPVVRFPPVTVQSAVHFTPFTVAVCFLFHRLQFGNSRS